MVIIPFPINKETISSTGPNRKEIMTKSTLEKCLEVAKNPKITTIDLTGGAPTLFTVKCLQKIY